MIHTEMEIEGGDEAWDTERETEKRKRQNTITVRFSAAIHSLARLRTPKPQAHTGIEIEQQRENFSLSQMVEREKFEKKVRLCHHQTTVPSTDMVSVFFLYQRSVYSLPLQILFLQYERLKLLTIAFPIRIRILNLQYFYVSEFKTGSSPYLIFQGSSFTPFKKKKKKWVGCFGFKLSHDGNIRDFALDLLWLKVKIHLGLFKI